MSRKSNRRSRQREPVSKLVPVRHKPKTLFGAHRGKIVIKGDIVSPLGAWQAGLARVDARD